MKALYPFKSQYQKETLWVEVEILDYKSHFGRKMCLVTPVRGEGKLWVNQEKVKVRK